MLVHSFTEYSPMDYLKIDMANSFGENLDKQLFEERIAWFDAQEDLESLVEKAEEPPLFYGALQAYRDAQQGKPIGFPISLDACSSGLQILSVLIGCRKSAKLCGVSPTGKREDAYTTLYGHMLKTLGTDSNIARSDTKDAIMTSLYSSTAIPKQVFGEGKQLEVFYETMETRCTGAWELNKALQGLWNGDTLSHDWVLPDGYNAVVPVMGQHTEYVQVMNQPISVELNLNIPQRQGRSISPNIVHSIDGMMVREIVQRASITSSQKFRVRTALKAASVSGAKTYNGEMVQKLWDLYKASGYLSSRILEYIMPNNGGLVKASVILDLIDTLPSRPFEVMPIHDCFRVHPNYGNDLRRQYNRVLSDIAKSDMLTFIARQLNPSMGRAKKIDDLQYEILNSDYTLS